MDPQWPPRLWRALKPGGLVVFQGNAPDGATTAEIRALWRHFHLIRFEDLNVAEDWFQGQRARTVKIVARKELQE